MLCIYRFIWFNSKDVQDVHDKSVLKLNQSIYQSIKIEISTCFFYPGPEAGTGARLLRAISSAMAVVRARNQQSGWRFPTEIRWMSVTSRMGSETLQII